MIQAIETQYNGYHFRSRLEARWAVFFDELGVRYEYEKEGYDLGELGWYLPDFWLPDLRTWFEIKPLSEKPVVPKVYCAGRIGYHNSDWRRDYGAKVYYSVDEMVNGDAPPDPEIRNGIFYTGPHLIDEDAPGHGHGFVVGLGHYCDRDELIAACLQQIRESDIMLAVLDDNEAHGTLVEIGYAKALGKPVWVGVSGPFVDEREYWFVLHLADKVFRADQPPQIMAEAFPWPPPEIAKAAAVRPQEGGREAFVAYGDPVEDQVYRCTNHPQGWMSLHEAFVRIAISNQIERAAMVELARLVPAAAAAARAARFEHGRKGAR